MPLGLNLAIFPAQAQQAFGSEPAEIEAMVEAVLLPLGDAFKEPLADAETAVEEATPPDAVTELVEIDGAEPEAEEVVESESDAEETAVETMDDKPTVTEEAATEALIVEETVIKEVTIEEPATEEPEALGRA